MSSKVFSRRARLFAVLAVVSGVSFGFSFFAHHAEAKKAKGKSAAAASTDECKTDKDCVLVPDECCPCSQGGKQRAIPKKQKDSYEKERKKRCGETACIEAVSTDPSCSQRPFCGAGICELGDAPSDAPAAPAAP